MVFEGVVDVGERGDDFVYFVGFVEVWDEVVVELKY